MECIGPCTALPRFAQGLTGSVYSRISRPLNATRCSNRSFCSRQELSGARCDASAGGVWKNQTLRALVGGTALAAAAWTLCTPPAWAELESVPPAAVSSLATAIPQQKVDKGRIWLTCILGAAALFGGTILLENNSKFFPAISKANKAMASARKIQEARANMNEAIDVGGNADERLQSKVSAGLSEARQRVLSEPAGSSEQEDSTAESGGEDLGQQHDSKFPVALHEGDANQVEEGERLSGKQEWKERELVVDSGKNNNA